MLLNEGKSLECFEEAKFQQFWDMNSDQQLVPHLKRHIGSGSGGYADHIFQYAAKELFNIECDKLQYKTLRYFSELIVKIMLQILL